MSNSTAFKISIFSIMVFLFGSISFAQISPYSKTINEISNAEIQATSSVWFDDESYFIIGTDQNYNSILIKMNSNGETIWGKTLTFPNYEGTILTSIFKTSDNHLICSGNYDHYSNNIHYNYYCKISSEGVIVWEGSTNLGNINRICETEDGYLFIGKTTHNESEQDQVSLFKINLEGDFIWGKIYPFSNYSSTGYSIKNTEDGNLIMTGYYRNNITDPQKGFITKINSSGNIIWSKSYSDEYNSNPKLKIEDIIQDGEHYYILGNSQQSVISKLDLEGNIIESIYEYPDYVSDNNSIRTLKLTSNHKLAFIGSYWFGELLLIDTDFSESNMVGLELNSLDVLISSNDELLVMGNGPLWGVKNNLFRYNIGIIQLDSDGNGTECSWAYSGSLNEFTLSAADNNPPFIDAGSAEEITANTSDFQIYSEDGCVDFIGGIDDNNKLKSAIYPNPNDGQFNISLNLFSKGELKISNQIGQLVYSMDFNTDQLTIDLSYLPKGIYFYQIETNNTINTAGKILIEK